MKDVNSPHQGGHLINIEVYDLVEYAVVMGGMNS